MKNILRSNVRNHWHAEISVRRTCRRCHRFLIWIEDRKKWVARLYSLFHLQFPFLIKVLQVYYLLKKVIHNLPTKKLRYQQKNIVFYKLIRYPISNFRKFKRCYKSRIESLCLIIKKFQESYIKISNISIKTNKKYWKQMEEQLLYKISRTGFAM